MRWLAKRIRMLLSAFFQDGTGGLIQPGDWRCIYPDGNKTYFMSRGDAKNCLDIWGGSLEWKYDDREEVNENILKTSLVE